MRLMLIIALGCFATSPVPNVSHGPFVGHVSKDSARVWARFSQPGDYELAVIVDGSGEWETFLACAGVENDLCVAWDVGPLQSETLYHYVIQGENWTLSSPDFSFVTAPADDSTRSVSMAFASCAFEDWRTRRVWERIDAVDPDVVVLLGDAPYIDTTDLAIQRQRYRDFLSVIEMKRVIENTPFYATWDDHDFGLNDADGLLEGKENSRRAFIEYHANPSYGNGGAGVYTSFRRGPVEVFLLDTRYFAATENSPAPRRGDVVGTQRLTLLGRRQWRWLCESLLASEAPFKILASGMVWNGAVRPNKTDHWETYAHERDALFAFIGEHHISGVVLVSGDVHRSRIIRHAARELAGYDLVELIISPMHHQVIAAADVAHPGLIMDLGAPNSYMLLEIDPAPEPQLRAHFRTGAGQALFQYTLNASELRAALPDEASTRNVN